MNVLQEMEGRLNSISREWLNNFHKQVEEMIVNKSVELGVNIEELAKTHNLVYTNDIFQLPTLKGE